MCNPRNGREDSGRRYRRNYLRKEISGRKKMKKIISILSLIVYLIIFNITGCSVYVSENLKVESKLSKTAIAALYSEKPMGVTTAENETYFRLFAPNAEYVSLVLFSSPEEESGDIHKMSKDNQGVWELTLDGGYTGKYYNFLVEHDGEEPVLCLDPYARAVVTYNSYWSPRKGMITDETYDWEGDTWIQRDWRDLIIYEMHIKDMTAHPSSGASEPGTYKALTEKGITGGIDYIRDLGVNTVELLPAQEFANIEIPFNKTSKGRLNTWNPYERNHWGYMTAAFFAPESYYADNKFEMDKWGTTNGREVKDLKDMVKAFHKEGIAVIMDVVYNHISEYEFGNFKEIDSEYYFRLDEDGNYIAQSYCGNDFRTEAPMARRLIVESVLYWMKEYHIDGFRFDLGKLIDWQTVEEIIYQARKVNPNVIIVCEPWGGGYDPAGFSLRGWGSWNDQIRNGIKGENPINGNGWIFSSWYGNNDPGRIKSYVNGTLVKDRYGLFQKKEHSVNYLESHDGYTLGDFIRIGLGNIKPDEEVKNIEQFVKLTPEQMKLNKLAALFLFTSQGITMIHSGQEFARSKILPVNDIEDEHQGMIDHNSYNKDNEVNYINYEHAKLNKDLLDYYKGLISLRNNYQSFRRASYSQVKFIETPGNPFALGYHLNTSEGEFMVLFNAAINMGQEFTLPKGRWSVIADENNAGTVQIREVKDKVTLGLSSGMVIKKK
jgi:pullulanase